jgi:hypothetical protein
VPPAPGTRQSDSIRCVSHTRHTATRVFHRATHRTHGEVSKMTMHLDIAHEKDVVRRLPPHRAVKCVTVWDRPRHTAKLPLGPWTPLLHFMTLCRRVPRITHGDRGRSVPDKRHTAKRPFTVHVSTVYCSPCAGPLYTQ